MRAKKVWTVYALVTCLFWNGILLAVMYLMGARIIDGFNQWVNPILATGSGIPEDLRTAFVSLQRFLADLDRYAAGVIFGTGAIFTLLLWFSLSMKGRGILDRAQKEAESLAGSRKQKGRDEEGRAKAGKESAPTKAFDEVSPHSAIQLLSILQREGRFIDFLQEDLNLFDDAQIGAAVRNIHQGCRDALLGMADVKPVMTEEEGAEVTIREGFDPRAVRLVGGVSGTPPFKGILRHRGWRVDRIELPRVAGEPKREREKDWIVSPAEVEVGES